MKIVKSYQKFNGSGDFSKHFGIEVNVYNEDNISQNVFNVTKEMCTLGVWIKATNITNPEFLSKYNIEYKIIDKKIIPIGFIDFDSLNYKESFMAILIDSIEDRCEIDQILKQLEEAIKYKYNSKKVANKCNDNTFEEVEF